MDYRSIETTYEVWQAIKNAHKDLRVYGSYTAPGNIFTSYGFNGVDYPIIEARTTWTPEIGKEDSFQQIDPVHRYWLNVATGDN